MDTQYIKSRLTRGLVGASIMGAITLGASAGLIAWISKNDVNREECSPPGVDWNDSTFAAGFVLYLFFGIVYACYQIVVQWTLAALTNDWVCCARYASMFKGTTSLGMYISFVLDSKNVTYMAQLIAQFVLYWVGLACLFGTIWFCVKPSDYLNEEDVIVPHKREERARIEGLVAEEQIEREWVKERVAAEARAFKNEKEVAEIAARERQDV